MTTKTPTEEQVQLATRLPKALHRAMKMHVVRHDVAIQAFVEEALREKLAKEKAHG